MPKHKEMGGGREYKVNAAWLKNVSQHILKEKKKSF